MVTLRPFRPECEHSNRWRHEPNCLDQRCKDFSRSNNFWAIEEAPKLRLDTLVDGSTRLSIVLTDVRLGSALETDQTLIQGRIPGPIQLFTGESTTFKSRSPTHSICHRPTVPEACSMSTPSVGIRNAGEFVGITPYQRASGSDGLTVETQDALYLEIDVRRLAVNA